jgi:hypothetical protein
VYPKGDKQSWQTVDTAGMSTWKALYNSDTSWYYGALNANILLSDPFDLGWGRYNMTTHQVLGDSIFLIKWADGSVQKLFVEGLIGGSYNFKYAGLDGSNEKTAGLNKSNFTGRNFGYYNLISGETIDIEPLATEWDLLFTKYTTQVPMGPGATMPYGVVGILTNANTKAFRLHPIGNPETYDDYALANGPAAINAIGYNWKKYDFGTGAYIIEDSTVYLVKTAKGNVWKLVMTGYGGSSTGSMSFDKELLFSTSLTEARASYMAVFPNPSTGGTVQVITDLESDGWIRLTDINGQVVAQQAAAKGLAQNLVPTSTLPVGTYVIQVIGDNEVHTQRLVIY